MVSTCYAVLIPNLTNGNRSICFVENVVAHLGLLPQSAGVLGGYKVQGKTAEQAEKLIQDALAVEEAGACAVVLECIPHQLTAVVSEKLVIPTIGIGAGAKYRMTMSLLSPEWKTMNCTSIAESCDPNKS